METLNIREAAERLGVSHKVIRRLISQGRIPARKIAGPHGSEWCLDADALETGALEQARLGFARAGSPQANEPPRSGLSATQPAMEAPTRTSAEVSREDTRFLQEHISQLTMLLREAVTANGFPHGQPSLPAISEAVGQAPESQDALVQHVTEALQSSLRSFEEDGIAALEMGSIKVLWGKPVLWKVVADMPDDVEALVAGILSPNAAWDPPGEEVQFLWARDAAGNAVWGTACGSGWFGQPFQSALRTARVERR